MKAILIIHVVLISALLCVCTSPKQISEKGSVSAKKLKEAYSGEVTFTLINEFEEKVQIESVRHIYIERHEGESWNSIPYIPCKCGTPCRPAEAVSLNSGASLEVRWEAVERSCERTNGNPVPNTVEEPAIPGEYRMIFTINRSQNGLRIAPDQLIVPFQIK
ncbi:MAG: hypothetical protein AAF616_13230 [Bacteroidota bacterium]